VTHRENEDPKLIVDQLLPLLDNDVYVPEQPQEQSAPTQQMQAAAPMQRVQNATGKKLYLRLPDSQGLLWRKTMALIEIFEGSTPVVLYDGSTKSYQSYRGGIALTDYLLGEFVRLLGESNVILK
jgi:hypothetical protein